MTDAEVDTQFTVLAIMLSSQFICDHPGEFTLNVEDDVQATLWLHGYLPAQQMLLAEGATAEQVERARREKATMFNIVDP